MKRPRKIKTTMFGTNAAAWESAKMQEEKKFPSHVPYYPPKKRVKP